MTFQLQPGDYIRTASVPDDKSQAVIDAFVKAGAKGIYRDSSWEHPNLAWTSRGHLCGEGHHNPMTLIREVTLDQILGKPMLIEALKPGMRAKVFGVNVVHDGEIIRDEISRTPLWSNRLQSTDYEIIPADPVPWVPSEGDCGYYVTPSFHVLESFDPDWKNCVRTREGGEQGAKIMKVINAICNMPGYGEGEGVVYWWNNGNEYRAGRWEDGIYCNVMTFRFDAEENAQCAADYANNLIKEMQ